MGGKARSGFKTYGADVAAIWKPPPVPLQSFFYIPLNFPAHPLVPLFEFCNGCWVRPKLGAELEVLLTIAVGIVIGIRHGGVLNHSL